jgi:hypothetical protein
MKPQPVKDKKRGGVIALARKKPRHQNRKVGHAEGTTFIPQNRPNNVHLSGWTLLFVRQRPRWRASQLSQLC